MNAVVEANGLGKRYGRRCAARAGRPRLEVAS
jgi:hypothetical protein